jgi:hypothetical protein
MTGVDWVIAGALGLLALLGWANGFLSGALSLLGLVAGAWVGTRLAPLVLEGGSASPSAPMLGLAGAMLGGLALASGLRGVAFALRRRLRARALLVAEGVLGAALTVVVGAGIAWLLGAIALTNGGPDVRRAVQRSAILAGLNAALPPSGPLLNVLARLDPLPLVTGPTAPIDPPSAAAARDPQVRAAAASVAKVIGSACGLGVEGSAWVAGDELVVTNAHVVAGQDDTRVLVRGRGAALAATAVHYDSRNDLAILRVEGLDAPALRLAADPAPGTGAAVLGFPRNGPYDVRAARIGVTRTVRSQDSYGAGPVRRAITAFRARVRPGNSGGPVVDGRGRVATTVFAAATSGPRGGYGVPNAVVRRALDRAGRSGAVSTGACTR